MMDKKETYEEQFQAQLDEWSAKIDVLKAKAAQGKSEAKIKYQEEIEELEEKRAAAQEKLKEFRSASEGAWSELKTGLEKAWSDLGEAVKSATSHFN